MSRNDHAALVQLNEDFCYELDRGTPDGFAALFAVHALYTHGTRRSQGRAEILDFARSRIAGSPRTSRHVQSGLKLRAGEANTATGVSCCVTWAASAHPPIADTAVLLVADFHDSYIRIDGHWLFAERRIEPIFTPAAAHG